MTFCKAVDNPRSDARVSSVSRRPFPKPGFGTWVVLVAAVALGFLLFPAIPALAQEDTDAPDSTPVATPEPDAPRVTIEFEELNDSGVTGEATLYEAGDLTLVEVELEDTGENHPAHIHLGTCEDIEPESAYDLDNVTEEGSSVTLVDISLGELLDGDYVIDLHISPNELGTLIVCADIEGQPANAEGTPADVGGPGDPTAEPTATEAATESLTTQPDETEVAVQAVTQEPTAIVVPTEEPTSVPTQQPTAEPTATPEPTPTPDDSTDGTGGAIRPIMSDGTGADSGKGSPFLSAPTPTVAAVGGTSSIQGDGTSGQSQALSGKGAPVGGTTSVMATTGSGPLDAFSPNSSSAAMWASGALALSLTMLAMALFMRSAAPRRIVSRHSVSQRRFIR